MNEILIYDDIGEGWFNEGITGASVKAQLETFDENESVTVRINSPGGDVFEGFAIYNLLHQHPGEINVRIDGLAASAASVVAMAADNIAMGEASMMMIHDPWTLALGDAAEFRKTAETLDKIKSSIITTYVTQTGLTEDEISDLMSEETWLTAEDAVAQGFAHSIKGKGGVDNRVMNRTWIKNAPKPPKQPNPEPTAQPEPAPEFRIAARKRLSAL